MNDISAWAKTQAESLLPPLGDRWLHVQGVVRAARQLAPLFNDIDASYLIAAAYVHDIGYVPQLAIIGFHPFDGANYVLAETSDIRLASLVAHHSGARFEGILRGVGDTMWNKYDIEHSLVADALDYCDMTTNSRGVQVTMRQRGADIRKRYPKDSIVVQGFALASPHLRAAMARTRNRLKHA